jgi:DNA primase
VIAQESIERVKSEASLLEVAGETIQLRRAGQYYSGLCPFHSEKSPSFFVRESSNTYTCYGCGASGNVISFTMATRAMTFPDAVEYLASRFKIPLKYDKGKKASGPSIDREKLFAIFRTAHLFFRKSLAQVKGGSGEFRTVGAYLKKRGLTSDAINTYGVGYAPNQRGLLIDVMKKAGFDEESAVLTGLVRRSASGELYELFRGRLVFPIFVDSKRIAAFGGRIVPGVNEKSFEEQAPKYLNSPESPIYQKSKTVYGLPQAMEGARASGELYVVEGYMDVVGLWMAGVRNVVACCGTAMTEQHVKRFSGLVNRVHLLFDGDAAGQGAAAKAFVTTRNAQVDIDVCFLPEDQDPDDFSRAHGADTSEALKSLPKGELIDVYIDGLLTRYGCSPTERPGPHLLGRMCDDVAKALAGIEKEVVLVSLTSRAGRRLGVDTAQLERLVKAEREKKGSAVNMGETEKSDVSHNTAPASPVSRRTEEAGDVPPESTDVSSLPRLDRELLCAVMVLKQEVLPDLVKRPVMADGLKPVTVAFITQLAQTLSEAGDDEVKQRESVKRLLTRFGPQWVALWKEAYVRVERQVNMRDSYSECLMSYERARLGKEIRALQDELPNVRDEGEQLALIHNLTKLQTQLQGLGRGVDLPASNS